MKSIFVLKSHSVVDLITNSSSEIFICSKSKEKEAVEQILRKLLENHNELSDGSYKYKDCFGDIEIAKYSFSVHAVPADTLEEYSKYHYVSGGRYSVYDDPEFRENQQKEKETQLKMGIVSDLYQTNPEKYSELTDKWYKSKERKKIWEKYNKKSKNSSLAIFKWFCEYNKIEGDFEAFTKRNTEIDYIPYDSKDELDKAFNEMKHLLTYNIQIQKGQIIIHSASDNTIPYELFGSIEGYLGAERYQEFKDKVEYFILLPYMNVGHAAKYPKKINYEALKRAVDKIHLEGKLGFGANWYNWLNKYKKEYNISMYLPEIFSKYLVLDGESPSVYNDSFEMRPVPFNHKTGCELGHSRTDFDIDKIENDAAKK